MEWIIALALGVVIGGVACWFLQEARAGVRQARIEAEHRERTARLQGRLQEADSTDRLLAVAKEQLGDAFRATAAAALKTNSDLLLSATNESLGKALESAKGEFTQRHEQFQALVRPLAENYEKLNPQIESLVQQSQHLASETGRLSNALTNSRQIGSWGEIQLRRIVELAGMVEHCDFAEQETLTGSRERPDLVVRLPERRAVVVDAKASTAAYLDAEAATDATAADEAMRQHAKALRTQVDSLARKDYGAQVAGSLDFVVMFVPGDQFLAAALGAAPTLVEYAMAKRVAIVTPASLISLLWTVASGWQQHRVAENVERIRSAGEEMHRRMIAFIRHYAEAGRGLTSAVDAYNRSVASFDARVAPQARKFSRLATGDEEIVEVHRIDQLVTASRSLSADGDDTVAVRRQSARE